MLRKALFVVLVVLLMVSFILPGLGVAQTSRQQASPPIRLKVVTFTPGETGSVEQALGLPPELLLAGYPPGVAGYYIVQFRGPVVDEWKAGLQRLGASILDYIPDYAFKVKMSPEVAARVQRYQPVNWVGIFQPAYKLSPQLRRTGTNFYRVIVEQSGDLNLVLASLEAQGVSVTSHEGRHLEVVAEADQLGGIASILDVAWVENFAFREKHNEYGGGVIMGANVANLSGYDGSTQIVAVADTGFGTGLAATAFADVPSSRITAIYDWPGIPDPTCYNILGDGAQDVDSGHGTHTAASVLSGGRPDGTGKGTAPAASLVFQAVEDYADMIGFCSLIYSDGYYLFGLPLDLHSLYQQAYDAGARIHSNSWGSNVAGDYTQESADTDDFVWDNPDMTITFSAGNAGTDGNSNGVVDNDSLGSPSTAKNVITVGASENDRQGDWSCDTGLTYTTCAGDGGQNAIFTYGTSWPANFPANPLNSDLSAGNANQMAAFSSRGPADDGRIKPDVVAPGTWVLSGYSDRYQEGYDGSTNPQNSAYQYDGWGNPENSIYKYMGGTSMSNPLTAGAAAVVRDYYQKEYSHAASAALTKATLINSATDLLDENNDGANDNDFPIPNNHEGWGLVNLVAATDGTQEFVDAAPGLGTGGSAVYQYDLNAGQPFKVSLVWTDFPSTAAAAANLVNNLDLVVTAPGGATYRGNVFTGGWSQTGGSADQLNNVENVYIQSAAAGIWTVQVSGTNVPSGPQPYALVVDGSFGSVIPTATLTPSPTATITPSPTATQTPTPTPTATQDPTSPKMVYLPWTTSGFVPSSCDIYFSDDFSNSASGWPVGDDGDILYEYVSGEYRILVRPTQWGAGAYPGLQTSDYSASVYLRNPNGIDSSYGIAFGIAGDWSTFYTLEIFPDGWFGIYRYDPGDLITLVEAFSPDIYQGNATNLIKVERNGGSINAYANGQLLASMVDGTYTGSRYIGLVVFSYDEPNVDIRFDNFLVYPVSCPGPNVALSTESGGSSLPSQQFFNFNSIEQDHLKHQR